MPKIFLRSRKTEHIVEKLELKIFSLFSQEFSFLHLNHRNYIYSF